MDINCDLGEGFGCEAEILPFIHSANIACGFHAGSPQEMAHTVALAKKMGVQVGAHPSWNDRANFGRTAQQLSSAEIIALITYQLGALDAICRKAQYPLQHVKPHGALYNQASSDPAIAGAIIEAVLAFNPGLQLYVLAGSQFSKLAKAAGLRIKEEAFADRMYQADGSLAPRHQPNAVLLQSPEVLKQVDSIMRFNRVQTVDGSYLQLHADTLCIHGDGPTAVSLAKAVHAYLQTNSPAC
ncbi:5-oxoprolinase subunit PxpA [Flavihumibacter sp. CACIAM 22H1]|uniref:5-oxoprolinase subunit PxpA n=1 Tax=Flavihumibacter sp. CACIAM 22H1 TaxID=1812911 RepID=UPI0007A7FA3B|nr:5-oxoprolinase subunit PxpA [Flavihumibacter sp. CACIAM 22H1]KYP15775.1 MAG: hypothetical protein A1D16_05410 [Flavihumibacter sp. CACIAM 22H1]